MSDAVTQGIRVVVKSSYVPERSSPEESYYFFAYTIRISNEVLEVCDLTVASPPYVWSS